MVSVLYAAALVWSWARLGTPPGVASVGGVSAVAAVWAYLLYVRPGEGRAGARAHAALCLLILVAVMANLVAVLAQLRATGSLPLVPAIATFAFTMVLRNLITTGPPSSSHPRPPREPASGHGAPRRKRLHA